jgi:hypothetical protein
LAPPGRDAAARHTYEHKDKDRTLVTTPPKRHREAKQKKKKQQVEEVPAFAEEVEMVTAKHAPRSVIVVASL